MVTLDYEEDQCHTIAAKILLKFVYVFQFHISKCCVMFFIVQTENCQDRISC